MLWGASKTAVMGQRQSTMLAITWATCPAARHGDLAEHENSKGF